MNKKNRKKGFTLVELVVVIAIIAILGAVSVVGYLGFIDKANSSACYEEAVQIKTVLFAGAAEGKEIEKVPTGLQVSSDVTKLEEYYHTITGERVDLTDPGTDTPTIVEKITYTAHGYTATIDLVTGEVTTAKAVSK